jgi:hypothetical protein
MSADCDIVTSRHSAVQSQQHLVLHNSVTLQVSIATHHHWQQLGSLPQDYQSQGM